MEYPGHISYHFMDISSRRSITTIIYERVLDLYNDAVYLNAVNISAEQPCYLVVSVVAPPMSCSHRYKDMLPCKLLFRQMLTDHSKS